MIRCPKCRVAYSAPHTCPFGAGEYFETQKAAIEAALAAGVKPAALLDHLTRQMITIKRKSRIGLGRDYLWSPDGVQLLVQVRRILAARAEETVYGAPEGAEAPIPLPSGLDRRVANPGHRLRIAGRAADFDVLASVFAGRRW